MRYIRYYEIKNILKHYHNKSFAIIFRATCISLGYENNEQLVSKEAKRHICNYIKREFGFYDVSCKQLSRLIHPRKHKFSKYAPIYLAAMYNILLDNWQEYLHTDICCNNGADKTYICYALNLIYDLVAQASGGRPEDSDIAFFLNKCNIVNNKLESVLGICFQNTYEGRRKITREDINGGE